LSCAYIAAELGQLADILDTGNTLAEAPETSQSKERVRKAGESAKPLPRSKGRPAGKRGIGKDHLIHKTIELLRTVPPEKLSLSMAARHAGVHLTLFKYYFTDRTRLLVDVARNLSVKLGGDVAAVESSELTAMERFRIRIDTMVDFFFINPFYHRLMVEIIGEDTDPLATELINIWMTKTLDIYRGIIDAGVKEGSLRPIDPYFTFIAIMALCEQAQHASRLAPPDGTGRRPSADQTAAQYKAYVYELLLSGIGEGS
jgi:AcrR family transcriptional regulator